MYDVVGQGIVFCDTLYTLIICMVFPPFPINFCQVHLPISSEPEAIILPHHLPRVDISVPPGRYVFFTVGILLHAVVVLDDLHFHVGVFKFLKICHFSLKSMYGS